MTKTQSNLIESVKLVPRLVGLRVNSDGWKNYLWKVTLERWSRFVQLEYHCGTGHVKDGVPTPPELSDVIYSLLTDLQGGRETFEDFCASFGYDDDSRKAHRIWLKCKASGAKLAKLFSPDEIAELQEACNEY